MDLADIKHSIATSNAASARGNAKYILQEHVTLRLLYEQDTVTRVWRLRQAVTAEEFVGGFLRMYVSRRFQAGVVQALSDGAIRPHARAQGAVAVAKWLLADPDRTEELLAMAKSASATLLDAPETWPKAEAWQELVSRPVSTSIYWAKLACALLPDLGLPYDTTSRAVWQSTLRPVRVDTIGDFLLAASQFARNLLHSNHQTLADLRHWDRPDVAAREAGLTIDYWRVALPELLPTDTHWPMDWQVLEMPVGRVLDKLFYNPTIR